MADALQAIVIAAIAAVPPTLVAWAALRQSRVTAHKTDENTRLTEDIKATTEGLKVSTEENAQSSAKLQVTTDQIHVLTNSRLSQVLTDLTMANERIASLEALVHKLAGRHVDGNGGRS